MIELMEPQVRSSQQVDGPTKIEVRNLDFFYGKSQALKEVVLHVPVHAVTAIIGPSGCGKSTLLRTLNRIYEIYPDQRAAGEILIDGSDILDRRFPLSDLRRRVGMVFQKPTPFATSIRAVEMGSSADVGSS